MVFCHRVLPICLMAFCLLANNATLFAEEKESVDTFFQWQNLPALTHSVQGAFVAVSRDALIVTGGTYRLGNNSEPDQEIWSDKISVLELDRDSGHTGFKLPHPLAYGASVATDKGLIMIGGSDGQQCYATVSRLHWNATEKKIEFDFLPDLPKPSAYASACIQGEIIYVVGGVEFLPARTALKNFWALDLSKPPAELKWEVLDSWPEGPGRILPVTAIQNSGQKDCLYLFGGSELIAEKATEVVRRHLTDAYRYDPFEKDKSKQWKRVSEIPNVVTGANAIKMGPSHILVFPLNEADQRINAYHTITDTWVPMDRFPETLSATHATKWKDQIVMVGHPSDETELTAQVWAGKPGERNENFGLFNYATLISYLFIMLFVGYYFSKKEKTTDDYFLAGRRIPWWAAGISIKVTSFSAIGFVAVPAKVYATNWVYLLSTVAMLPAILITIYVFLPVFRKLNVTSVYEYLEKRFNLPVRLFGSTVFILFQIGRMAIVLLLPSLALSTVTGINVFVCISFMGIFCIIYTVLGGIEAVIWTDVLQMVVLTGAAFLVFFVVASKIDGGASAIFSMGKADAKFQLVNWTWDYRIAALWVVLVGNFLANFAPYISDQSIVQRYMTTPSLKQARQSLWFTFWYVLPNAVLFFLMGTALYVFYKVNPHHLNPTLKTDAILNWFVMKEMPAGVSGLVIAGIFAAAMSSLDSAMHSGSTVIVTDFYRRFRSNASEKFCLNLARWIIVILGVISIVIALIMAASNITSLLDLFMELLGLLGGGLAGIFMLGILTHRANGTGAFIGVLVSTFLVFVVQHYTHLHFFLFGAIGVVSAVVAGYLASLIIPGQPKDLQGLTLYTLNRQEE